MRFCMLLCCLGAVFFLSRHHLLNMYIYIYIYNYIYKSVTVWGSLLGMSSTCRAFLCAKECSFANPFDKSINGNKNIVTEHDIHAHVILYSRSGKSFFPKGVYPSKYHSPMAD